MEFNLSDQQSSTWQKLKAHLKDMQATLRETADIRLDAEHRSEVVGKLSIITLLLALEEDFVERTERRNDGVHL